MAERAAFSVNRRFFLKAAASIAPAIILTPGLLMPVRKLLVPYGIVASIQIDQAVVNAEMSVLLEYMRRDGTWHILREAGFNAPRVDFGRLPPEAIALRAHVLDIEKSALIDFAVTGSLQTRTRYGPAGG